MFLESHDWWVFMYKNECNAMASCKSEFCCNTSYFLYKQNTILSIVYNINKCCILVAPKEATKTVKINGIVSNQMVNLNLLWENGDKKFFPRFLVNPHTLPLRVTKKHFADFNWRSRCRARRFGTPVKNSSVVGRFREAIRQRFCFDANLLSKSIEHPDRQVMGLQLMTSHY